MPTIVGLAGYAGSGKSAAARHLQIRYGFRRLPFAGPLKDMLKVLGLTEDDVNGAAKETPSEILCGRTPRLAMQTLGTEWGRNMISARIWTDAWLRRVRAEATPVVVEDVRFLTETAEIRALGGQVWKIERPGRTAGSHQSEREILEMTFDRVIWNDDTMDALIARVDVAALASGFKRTA